MFLLTLLRAALLICMVMGPALPMTTHRPIAFGGLRMRCRGAVRQDQENAIIALKLQTNRGDIDALYHLAVNPPISKRLGVVFVGGAGGGLDGPARGLYPAVAKELQRAGIAALRVDYRHPNHLEECVLDTLCGVEFLRSDGVERVAVVGHSFGGAVVISAGAVSRHVYAVVPMSSQTFGADLA